MGKPKTGEEKLRHWVESIFMLSSLLHKEERKTSIEVY